MLKFIIIGVVIIGIFAFALWSLWKSTLLKRKRFSESALFLKCLDKFKDAPQKFKRVKGAEIRTMIVAVISSVLVVGVVSAYFIIARSTFVANHAHSYKDKVIKKPTCVAEGVMEYNCRYCDEKYEKSIPIIAHNHVKSNAVDATCTKTGKTELKCEMCGDIKTETIPIKAHEYIENVEKEATCITVGIMTEKCKNCDSVIKKDIPKNNKHDYEVVSYKKSSFWKNGYNHYSCKDCKHEDYSLRVYGANWIVILAALVALITIIIVLAVRGGEGSWRYAIEKPTFWVALVLALLSIGLMVAHWGVIRPHQKANKPILRNITDAPVGCKLVEENKVESTYTVNGTIQYKCTDCNMKYTEQLPLKEFDAENIPVYSEPELTKKKEKENNNKIDKATGIPMNTEMTGNLSTRKDIDFYKVEAPRKGKITFKLTHNANEYSNHWYGTIYASDKKKVLAEGVLDKEVFGCGEQPAGTYYLKISAISGGNPLMNIYTDEDYHLSFIPECSEHAGKMQYFTEKPKCTEKINITTVCKDCGTVVTKDEQYKIDHRWGEWKVIKAGSVWSAGERVRTCELCDETKKDKFYEYGWMLLLILLEIIWLISASVALGKDSEKRIAYIIGLLAISCLACVAVLNKSIFAGIGDSIVLGVIFALNITPIAVLVGRKVDSVSRSIYAYQAALCTVAVVFAAMLALGFTVLSGYALAIAIIMGTIMIDSIAWAIAANDDCETGWMVASIILAVLSAAATVFFILRI